VVNSERLSSLRQEVDRHREWSDAEALTALTQRGARATPDQLESTEKFFEQRLQRLRPWLGPIKVESAEFLLRDTGQYAAGLPAADLQWRIQVQSAPPDSRPSEYLLRLEPFEGELVQIRPLLNRLP
jgi:hypothetical protein